MRVNDDADHPTSCNRGIAARTLLLEAALVAVLGVALAFAANALSPRRLALTRNYFPGTTNRAVAAPLPAPPPDGATNQSSAAELLAGRIKAEGFHLIDRDQLDRLFHDPRYEQGQIVFIDARDEEHYREGHIPGAYELDPYRPEQHLATVLPVCQAADEIVVYCNGGDCEDSQFGAVLLRDAGVASPKLFVYAGGMSEWATNGLPVEIGERRSGDLRNAGQ